MYNKLRAFTSCSSPGEMAGGDDVTHGEVCIGTLCFQRPYSTYVPPPFYPRLPHKQIHKWKVQAMLTTGCASEFKIGRVYILPHCFGLGETGSWRWRWIPISMLFGFKGGTTIQNKDVDSLPLCAWLSPYIRLKSLTPAFGKLALQPVMKISTVPAVEIQRKFSVGPTTFGIRASLMARTEGFPWSIQLTWNSTETDTLRTKVDNDVMTLEYLWSHAVSKSCNAVLSAAIRMPFLHNQRSFFGDMNFGSVKVTQNLGLRASRDKPLPTMAYLKASEKMGQSRIITIAPGHCIDAGNESGALGEREFNLEIANLLEKDLHAHGWRVLRPDRDAPYLSWEEYLNWVSKQTCSGCPVVEIHGQGSRAADSRGYVVGVIGDPNILLNKELARNFGFFNMDWRELGVPRRGGVIVESFNSDEVLQMAPWERSQTARCIASQLVNSIQRASSRTDAKEMGH